MASDKKDISIVLIATFTESPSFNLRVKDCNGVEMFYNSERLQGNTRTMAVGKILGITELPVGSHHHTVSQEQYNAICGL